MNKGGGSAWWRLGSSITKYSNVRPECDIRSNKKIDSVFSGMRYVSPLYLEVLPKSVGLSPV